MRSNLPSADSGPYPSWQSFRADCLRLAEMLRDRPDGPSSPKDKNEMRVWAGQLAYVLARYAASQEP